MSDDMCPYETPVEPVANTFRGVDVDYLRFVYEAVCNQGVDINSNIVEAFWEGAKYGVKYVNDHILQRNVGSMNSLMSEQDMTMCCCEHDKWLAQD